MVPDLPPSDICFRRLASRVLQRRLMLSAPLTSNIGTRSFVPFRLAAISELLDAVALLRRCTERGDLPVDYGETVRIWPSVSDYHPCFFEGPKRAQGDMSSRHSGPGRVRQQLSCLACSCHAKPASTEDAGR